MITVGKMVFMKKLYVLHVDKSNIHNRKPLLLIVIKINNDSFFADKGELSPNNYLSAKFFYAG